MKADHNGKRFVLITFTKLSEARSFKKLLSSSNGMLDSVIIRTDTTKEGFIASEREVK